MAAKPIKTVLVGCGAISRSWLGAVRELKGIEITGLVDINADSAMIRKHEYGLDKAVIGTDLKVMLRTVKPEVVFDSTVPKAHVSVTLEALRHGCHVLGEKPLADNMANAKKMVSAAKKADRIFAVIQNRRYDRRTRTFRKVIASGKIGQLTTLNSDFYIGAHFGGFRESMKHVLLLDMAIHTFDAARLISGADPVSIFCREWNPVGSWYRHGASAVAVFEMSDGIIYTYRGSWCSEGLNTPWEGNWRAVGSKGSATWDGKDTFRAEAAVKTKEHRFISKQIRVAANVPVRGKPEGHKGLIAEFIHCVRTGKAPETVCTDNIKSLAMVFGAIESAKTGKTVRIKDLGL